MDDYLQLYLHLFSGQDPNSAPPPFFQQTPPPQQQQQQQAPIMGLGGFQRAVDPVAMMPMLQRACAGNASGLPPATLAPGEGSLTAGADAFLGDDLLMSMTSAELSAFLSDGPDGSSLCVPPECLMGSLDQTAMDDSPSVPPGDGPTQPSSGSPGLGSAQVMRATDSPASGVEELLMRMTQSSFGFPGLGSSQARATDSPASGVVDPLTRMTQSSFGFPATDSPASGVVDPLTRMTQSSFGFPGLGSAQARATDSPASGVVDPLTRMSGDGLRTFLSDGAAVNSLCVPPECLMNSLVAYQPAMDGSPSVHPADGPGQSFSGSPGLGCAQARATDSPVDGAYPPAPPAASLDAPQQVPDSMTAEVTQMVRVAELCGDMPSTAWSMEEDELLLQDLSRFAGQDNVKQCLIVASRLPEKTALDVAYRIRWMTDLEKKKKAAKELGLGQEKSAGGNVTKGKGTKVANKKNSKHPLSKEALDSRSVKDIIRDNNRLMDKIEEILRTGEVNNCPEYFYYVKMNMDAVQNKVKDLGSVMEGLSVGDEEWDDVLKDRDAPQAGDDAATPAP